MIIEYLKSKKSNNQGRVGRLINYIFGKTKHTRSSNQFDLTNETIEFIGYSSSILLQNPLISFNDGRLIKLSGKEADLAPTIHMFLNAENQNKRVKHPIEHIVVSLPEGESLNSVQWKSLADELTKKLGFTDHHWVAVLHKDTKNQHLHLACCSISNSAPHRRLVLSNSYKKTAMIRNELEKMFGLKHDHNPYTDGPGKKVNNAKYKTKVQTIRSEIDTILRENPQISLLDFITRLGDVGIGCFIQTRRDEVRGVSFSIENYKISGSKLGIGYSWRELSKRGVSYNISRDLNLIIEFNNVEKRVTSAIENFELPQQPSYAPNLILLKTFKIKLTDRKRRSKYKRAALGGIWIRNSFKGMKKHEIEQLISISRILRKLLTLYFLWLAKKDREKQIAFEKLKPYLKRLREPTDGDVENSFSF